MIHHPSPSSGRPDRRRSDAIRIARITCIFGVVYVHAWTGLAGPDLAAMDSSAQGVLRWALMELFGAAAVPLLGLIAGWLVVDSARKRPNYRDFLGHKARTLLLPMLLWNLAAILLVSGAAAAGAVRAPVPEGLGWWVNELTSLTRPNQINVQMPFLRDLFVCVAAAPLLVRAPTSALIATALFAVVWSLSGVQALALLRPAILAYFALGILIRRHGLEERIAAQPLVARGLAFLALAAFTAWTASGHAPGEVVANVRPLIDLVLRFVAAVFFWSVAWRLAGSRSGAKLAALEPVAFMLFCSHLILIWLFGPVIGRVTGPLGAPLYPLFLIAQPFLVLAAVQGVAAFLARRSPAVVYVLSGRRIGRRPASAEAG